MAKFTLWGVIASPFQLKMQSLLDFAGHDWERWPDQGRWSANVSFAYRLTRARKNKLVQKYDGRTPELDEYPAVPFYTEDGQTFFYDSTALAHHLDQHPERHDRPLVPEDPTIRFVCQLVDEAFDEFGLYMAHHNRWVISAKDNRMPEETGREFGKLMPILLERYVRNTAGARQVRRAPYLFSVAPEGFTAEVPEDRIPKSLPGFPPTHDLLNLCFLDYLLAIENILKEQRYLLGERFTLADASVYGQLNMHCLDPAAYKFIEQNAPTTWAWLQSIEAGHHENSAGRLFISKPLKDLLRLIGETFVPLMQQNEAAYVAAIAQGETLFNERAFDQSRSLYDGILCGQPFRSVVKTFQVSVWRKLKSNWHSLPQEYRSELTALLPTETKEALSA